jgi:hypothetical protein
MNSYARLALVLLAGCAHARAQSKPVDLTLGWTYGYTDQGNGFANLNGWYGTATWEFSQRVGLTVEHESFWGGFQGGGVSQHVWLGGITVKLRPASAKISPFLQPMGGATRSSSAGTVQQQPTFQFAGGADITLKGNLSLELVPAEYTLSHGNGSALNTYQAGAGLQYSFGKK